MWKFKRAELEWIATTMRSIWLRRNKLIFKNQFYSLRKVIQMTSEGMKDFSFAQESQNERHSTTDIGRSTKCWEKPDTNVVKVNWNVALDPKSKIMGLGIIIRDDEGEILVSVCANRRHVTQSALAKCYALWRAIEVCNDLAFQNVILEGDALVIIKVVNIIEKDSS